MNPDLVAIQMKLFGGKQVAAETAAVAGGMESVGTAAKKSATQQSALRKQLQRQVSAMKTVGRGMTHYLTIPIVGVAAAAGFMAVDFDKAMRNVNSIAQLPERQFDALKQSVLGLAGPTAQAPKTLAEGMYDLVSSGFDAKESLHIVKYAALAATAGLTDTAVSTKAVAAVLNAYEFPAKKAAYVSDVLFRTVDRGVLTFEELASHIGAVLPFASSTGVALPEIGAAISTLTKQGMNSAEAFTFFKNAIVAFNKPSKQLSTAIKETGFESGEALIKARGFEGALLAVAGTTDESRAAMSELFPNIRAQAAAFGLTGLKARAAKEDIAGFKDVAGATQHALHQQEKSFAFKTKKVWVELQVSLIKLGEQVLPVVIPPLLTIVGAVTAMVEAFGKLPESVKVASLALLALVAVTGPILTMVAGVLSLGLALTAAGVSLGALAAGAGIVVGVLALAVGFFILYKEVEAFRNVVDAVFPFVKNQLLFFISPIGLLIAHFDDLKNVAGVVGGVLSDAFHGAVSGVGRALDAIVGAVTAFPGLVWKALKRIPRLLGQMVGWWVSLPFRITAGLVKLYPMLFKLGIQAVGRLFDAMKSAVPAVIGFMAALPGRLRAAAGKLVSTLFDLGARAIGALADGVKSNAGAVFNFFRNLPGKLLSLAGQVAGKLAEAGRAFAREFLGGFYDALPGPVRDALGTVGDVVGGAGDIVGKVNPFGHAAGGFISHSELSLVGEAGPEIVALPYGARVYPHGATPRGDGRVNRVEFGAAQRGGRTYLAPVVLRVGRRKLAEIIAETQEDEAARQ